MQKSTHPSSHKNEEKINIRRRHILNGAGLGVLSFVFGGIFNSQTEFFSQTSATPATLLKNFNVVDSEKELTFYDKRGNEVVIIEKDGF